MRRLLDIELFLQPPARLKEPIAAVLRDRARLALALGVQHAAPFAHPRPTTLRTGDELARIELHRHRLPAVRQCLARLIAFAREPFFGLAQRLAPALAGAQLLWQL